MAPPRPAELPADFARSVAAMRATALRPEVVVSDSPAPQRLAPFAVALSAEVVIGGAELATGRLVVLHDPAGQDAWEGPTRLVAFAHAALDAGMASDPLLPAVGWSWLLDALTAADAPYTAAGGTVTRVQSERFGALAGQPELAEIELRASWSPADPELGPHLAAFAELLCSAAGLPPMAPGVVAIPPAGRSRPRRSRARA